MRASLLIADWRLIENRSFAQSLPLNPPFFTAAGIVQAATQTAGTLAPNTIATIYGTNLSWTTHIRHGGRSEWRNPADFA